MRNKNPIQVSALVAVSGVVLIVWMLLSCSSAATVNINKNDPIAQVMKVVVDVFDRNGRPIADLEVSIHNNSDRKSVV